MTSWLVLAILVGIVSSCLGSGKKSCSRGGQRRGRNLYR